MAGSIENFNSDFQDDFADRDLTAQDFEAATRKQQAAGWSVTHGPLAKSESSPTTATPNKLQRHAKGESAMLSDSAAWSARFRQLAANLTPRQIEINWIDGPHD